MRVPYGRRGALVDAGSIADLATEAGWALLVQDVRGTGDSDGLARPFEQEPEDGFATVEWIRRQRFGHGEVLPIGESYYGYSAWAAATHPSVRRLVAVMTTTRVFDGWFFRRGVFRLGEIATWAAATWTGRGFRDIDLDWTIRPFAEIVPRALGYPLPALDRWATSRRDSVGVATLNFGRTIDPYLVTGSWDPFLEGATQDWRLGRRRGHLRIAAVDHIGTSYDGRPHLRPLSVAVKDVLASSAADAKPIGVSFERRSSAWTSVPTWPLPVPMARLSLSSDLVATPGGRGRSAIRSQVSWLHDPAAPVPTAAPLWSATGRTNRPMRPDQLRFIGSPAPCDRLLSGPASIRLALAGDLSPCQVAVELEDVAPDNQAELIAETAALWVRTGRDVELVTGPFAYDQPAGHRLRLGVATTSFPRYIILPGTGEPAWHAESFLSGSFFVDTDNSGVRLGVSEDAPTAP
jgi:hypothetical protein